MTWLAPWMLAGAAVAAAIAIALHVIAWDRPQPAPLPTARFVPEPRFVPAARRKRLSDMWLLMLRLLTILLAGAAFARPVLVPERAGGARVLVLDRSRAVADWEAAQDSARAWRRDGDALVVFDTAALVVAGTAAGEQVPVRGSVSAGLIAGIRALALDTRARPESSEVVLVSPLLDEEIDAATTAIRALWPGAVRLVRVAPADVAERRRASIEVRAEGDDPIAAAARLIPQRAGVSSRIVRGPLTAADSVFANGGGALVHWPPVGAGEVSGALVGFDAVAVAPFVRPASVSEGGAKILRWADGEPAAHETALGTGCVRKVNAGVPEGDAVLRPRFLGLLGELTGPCRTQLDPALAGDSVIRALGATDSTRPIELATTGFPLAPWLFAAAFLTALAELLVRRQR